MFKSSLAVVALAAASVTMIDVFAQPQAKSPSQSEMKKQFAAMSEKGSAPTEQHKLLDAFVGEFDQITQVSTASGEPMKVHSLSKGQRILGGRFVRVESASAPDEELKGERILIYGYDPRAQKFTLWNIESWGLVATTATGDYDAAKRTFTFDGEREQPGAGKVPFGWMLKLEDGGAFTQTIQMKFPGAQDFTTFVTVKQTRTGK